MTGVQKPALEGGCVETIDNAHVRDVALTHGWVLTSVRPFPPTPTSWAQAYLVTDDSGRESVVRRVADDVEPRVISGEFRYAEMLSAVGISPHVNWRSVRDRVLCMEYIESDPCADLDVSAIVRMLATLHSQSVSFADLDLFATKQAVCEKRLQENGSLRGWGQDLLAAHGYVRDRLASTQGSWALCHNDLNPTNILRRRDGRHFLIDLDHMGPHDPLFDVATVTLVCRVPPGSLGDVLAEYFGRPASDRERWRLGLMRAYVLLRYGVSTSSFFPELMEFDRPLTSDGPGPFALTLEDGGSLPHATCQLARDFSFAGLRAFSDLELMQY